MLTLKKVRRPAFPGRAAEGQRRAAPLPLKRAQADADPPCLLPWLRSSQLLSPLSAAEVGTIRAIGLNYSDHAAEMGLPHPALPVQFLKPPSTVANPGAVVEVPLMAQDDQVDWEVELAIVIGRQAKNVSEEDALDYVLGYTVANDVRLLQHSPFCARACPCEADGRACLLFSLSSRRARSRSPLRSGVTPRVRPLIA